MPSISHTIFFSTSDGNPSRFIENDLFTESQTYSSVRSGFEITNEALSISFSSSANPLQSSSKLFQISSEPGLISGLVSSQSSNS